jgi:hypothetical protein
VNGRFIDHPFMLVRSPRVGPNSELEILRSMAVRLEWVDPDTQAWKTTYCERFHLWRHVPGHNNILSIHRTGMALVQILMQWNYTNRPAWLPPLGRQIVKHLHLDHLWQTVTVRTVPVTSRQWPPDNTMQQNMQRLLARFPPGSVPNVTVLIGTRPNVPDYFRFSGAPQSSRKSCDICLSLATVSDSCTGPGKHLS